MALTGPNSFYPLSAFSRKQTCVSHSTPEAELVAADVGLRSEGLPAQTFWKIIKEGSELQVNFYEDNQTALHVMKTGKNPNMRHLSRTHKVCTNWLHEVFDQDPTVKLIYSDSLEMCADIFTKEFYEKDKWIRATDLISICSKTRKPEPRTTAKEAAKRIEERRLKEQTKNEQENTSSIANLRNRRLLGGG